MNKRIATLLALLAFAAFTMVGCSGEVVKPEEQPGKTSDAGSTAGGRPGQAGQAGVSSQDLAGQAGQGTQTDAGKTAGAAAQPTDGTTVAAAETNVVPPGQQPGSAPQSVPELKTIHFDYDKSAIRAEDTAILKANYQYLKTNDVRVLIEGHCDERGTTEYNIALGERRANATKRFLVDLGLDPARVDIITYGEERPLVRESNEAAWAQNRRAEFKVTR
jgi:peptidoglycan-associated lipoprotein